MKSNNLKKGALVTVFVLVTAFTVSELFARGWGKGRGPGHGYCDGRGPGGPGMRGPKGFGHVERLRYDLDLTDAQVLKIIDINAEYRKKFYKNRGNWETMANLRIAHRKAVEAVLTKKQKEKFNSFWTCPYDRRFKRGYRSR